MAAWHLMVMGMLVMVVPYLLFASTLHYGAHEEAAARPRTSTGAEAAPQQPAPIIELSSYYEALDTARALLDSLEGESLEADSSPPPPQARQPPPAPRSSVAVAPPPSVPPPPPVPQSLRGGATTAGGATTTSRTAAGKDLVVGLAMEIALKQLAVFVGSLRQFSTADCVLFVDAFSAKQPALRALSEEHRFDVQMYEPQSLEPAHLRKYHPSSFRWPLIATYLASVADKGYRGVLMADVRDTAFQLEPFDAILGDKRNVFYAFNGVESRTIGECGWNGGWIRDCFGEKKRTALAKKPIVCSGVSIATYAEAAAYAAQMGAVVGDAAFAQCERNGVDQGVHNVLVHEGRVAGLSLQTQRTALVANLQARVASTAGNVVRNPQSALVAVVHQYDRFPDLAAHYYKTYAAAPADAADAAAGGSCGKYTLTRDVDLYKARCDLKAAGGNSADDCCDACTASEGCKGWTHAGTLCYLKTCATPATKVQMKGATSGFLT